MPGFPLLPTPPELFRSFERGEISREQLHSEMAVHARRLLEEMDQAHRNPIAAYIEQWRNRAAAGRLTRRYGPKVVREVLASLGSVPAFPPTQILWNAGHEDMPLHCFFRSTWEPVFRIARIQVKPMEIHLTVEYGLADKTETTRERLSFQRNNYDRLELTHRAMVAGG